MYEGSITEIHGLLVGHAQDTVGMTGVTVLLAPNGAVCGVDVRGSAPGTRETDFMSQAKTVQTASAILLAGGSAFGLAAADGVMIFCEQQGMGIKTEDAVVPIVPSAVIYDLGFGRSDIRPNAGMGYAACINAGIGVPQGSIGAGMGATVGKVLGMPYCQKGGVGTASICLKNGTNIGALVVVNAFGDVVEDGKIIAGARREGKYIDTARYLLENPVDTSGMLGRNTTIGVVATDAKLDKDGASKLAQVAHDGLARAISPIHTSVDGDTMFALSYGKKEEDLNVLITGAAEVTRRAVVNAVLAAVTG
ncbi:MAG: P1 family peptidase [Christensenella sp.]|nr:P1 family peptidase [Christensenella sp.]